MSGKRGDKHGLDELFRNDTNSEPLLDSEDDTDEIDDTDTAMRTVVPLSLNKR